MTTWNPLISIQVRCVITCYVHEETSIDLYVFSTEIIEIPEALMLETQLNHAEIMQTLMVFRCSLAWFLWSLWHFTNVVQYQNTRFILYHLTNHRNRSTSLVNLAGKYAIQNIIARNKNLQLSHSITGLKSQIFQLFVIKFTCYSQYQTTRSLPNPWNLRDKTCWIFEWDCLSWKQIRAYECW